MNYNHTKEELELIDNYNPNDYPSKVLKWIFATYFMDSCMQEVSNDNRFYSKRIKFLVNQLDEELQKRLNHPDLKNFFKQDLFDLQDNLLYNVEYYFTKLTKLSTKQMEDEMIRFCKSKRYLVIGPEKEVIADEENVSFDSKNKMKKAVSKFLAEHYSGYVCKDGSIIDQSELESRLTIITI